MNAPHTVRTDQLKIDMRQKLISFHDEHMEITKAEWEILAVLLREPLGQRFATDRLVTEVPRTGVFLSPETIRGRMVNLRDKLNQHRQVIEHQHGVGYRINPEVIDLITD